MMRYQLFNDPAGTVPVFSAPWRWLAYLVANLFSNKWDRCRLVDSQTGEPLMEWAQASGSLVFGGPSRAKISCLKTGEDGHCENCREKVSE